MNMVSARKIDPNDSTTLDDTLFNRVWSNTIPANQRFSNRDRCDCRSESLSPYQAIVYDDVADDTIYQPSRLAMKLLPYDSFVIETTIQKSDVIARLRAHVGPKSFLPRFRAGHDFEGEVSNNGFILRPSAHAHIAFLPEFHGRLNGKDESVIVTVQSVPNFAVLMILAILCGLLCMLVFSDGPKVFATAAACSVIAWFLSVCGFWIDGGRSRQKLEKILKVHSAESDTSIPSTLNSDRELQA